MHPSDPIEHTSCLRRIGYCLLPVLLGAGAAFVLLFVAGGRARRAYAANLNYPGCGASIQACIDGASPGDTILISAGDYTESLTLSQAVSLTGALSSTTILHAPPNSRVLMVTGAAVSSSVVISGLTFTGGNVTGGQFCPDGCGGGVQIAGAAQPQLVDVTILSNTASGCGGGLDVANDSALVLSQSEVVSNTSGNVSGGVGGGICNGTGTLLVTNSVVHGNRGYSGGGIFNMGTVQIANTLISNNVATYGGNGGGGLESWYGVAILTDTTVLSNTGYYGGGIDSSSGNLLLLAHSTISDNVSLLVGGGIHMYQSTATLSDTLIANNLASDGGGGVIIYDRNSTLTVTGSEISGNTGGYYGGGIDNSGVLRLVDTTLDSNNGGGLDSNGTLTVTNATITGNSDNSTALWIVGGTANLQNATIAYNHGGGIGASVPVTLENTIVMANAPDCSGTIISQGYNLIGSTAGCTISGVIVGNITGQDAHLGPLQNNGGSTLTHALLSGSPAINGGNPAGCRDDLGALISTDERGVIRPQGAACDIGAYEAILADLQITQTDPVQSVLLGDPITYTWQISNAGPSAATGILLTDTLPVSLTFGWMGASQGTCARTNTLNCNLGALAPAASLAITLVVTPTAVGQALDTPSVTGNEADPTFPDAATSAVTVLDRPIIGLGIAGQTPTVLGDATTFTASIESGTSVMYAWGFGDGNVAVAGPAPFISHTYPMRGAYQAVVTATNSVGQVTTTKVVSVIDQAISGLSAASSSPSVLGNATAFTASIASGTNVSFAWGFGNGVTGTGVNPSYTFPTVGLHGVVVTATNSVSQVTATATITVNDIPVAIDHAYATTEDVPLVAAAPGVLANARDAFPGVLTAQLASGPTVGTLVQAPTGAFTYTSPIAFTGLVTFTYQASDGLLLSPPATVTITVNAFKLYLPLVQR